MARSNRIKRKIGGRSGEYDMNKLNVHIQAKIVLSIIQENEMH